MQSVVYSIHAGFYDLFLTLYELPSLSRYQFLKSRVSRLKSVFNKVHGDPFHYDNNYLQILLFFYP